MKNSRPHSPLRWAKADREYTLAPVPALGERLTSLPLATIFARVPALGGSHSCSLSCSGTEPWWNCCFSTAPIPTNQRTYARTQTCTMARKRSKRLLIEDVELRRYLAEPLSAWRIDSNRLATPLSVALAVGDTSLVALLTAHGAQQPTSATAAGMPYLPCCTDAERARFSRQPTPVSETEPTRGYSVAACRCRCTARYA